MPRFNPLPKLEVLQKYLDFNPQTGDLTWIRSTGNATKVGNIIKVNYYSGPSPMRRVSIRGQGHLAHRVCWALYYKELPEPHIEIFHLNGDGSDNRIDNLGSREHRPRMKRPVITKV